MLTPDSLPQIVTSYGNSPKRKDREDSAEPETNIKKPRTDAPDDEDGERRNPPGDGKYQSVAAAALDREAEREVEDEPAGPVNTTDEGKPPVPAETCERSISPPPLAIPSIFSPRLWGRSTEDDEFDGCVVHPDKITTTFEQVYSNPDTIRALQLLTLSLRDAEAFRFGILSRQATSGVLLYGPPGTGKTMLVRALAKESGARMVAISYADIQSECVSVGERKVQSLFRYARRHSPCIIFIDEADSCFRTRSADQTRNYHINFINQFLTEMDGIDVQASNKPIVVAATNRPFDVDEGILRRLGRRIMVDVPDVRGREAILRLHVEGERLAPDLDLAEIARHTQDYTGSDIRDLAFQAAIEAVQEIHRQKEDEQAHDGVEGQKRSGADRVLSRRHFLSAKRSVAPAPKADLVAKIGEFHTRHGSVGQR